MLLIVCGLPMGLVVDVPGMLTLFGMVVLMGISLGSISYGLAMLLRDENSFAPFLNTFTGPLMLLSGVLLPMSFAPAWLATVAEFNPLFYVVEAGRSLFQGNFESSAVLISAILLPVLLFVTLFWAARSFRKGNA